MLVTHSMGGTIGWRTPFYTDTVKAIVAFEPSGTPFVFPEGEVPTVRQAKFAPLTATAIEVPLADFEKLTKIPMVLIFGDYIAPERSDLVGPDKWGTEFLMAKEFVVAVNRHGGQSELISLPELGIKGNSHFLMAERNNEQVAALVQEWLTKHGF